MFQSPHLRSNNAIIQLLSKSMLLPHEACYAYRSASLRVESERADGPTPSRDIPPNHLLLVPRAHDAQIDAAAPSLLYHRQHYYLWLDKHQRGAGVLLGSLCACPFAFRPHHHARFGRARACVLRSMHRFHNALAGQARQVFERTTPNMPGFGRPQQPPEMSATPPLKRLHGAPMNHNAGVTGNEVFLSFNVPFQSNTEGPPPDEILYSSIGAFQRWTHPEDADEGLPTHALPVHVRDVENLRSLCKQISESGEKTHATVISSKPKPAPGMQRGPLTALVTNVCVSGDQEKVHKARARILNETPITLVRG